MGLGLSITKELIAKLDILKRNITIESIQNIETKFSFFVTAHPHD